MTSFVAHCVFLVSDVNRWARNKETKLHAHSWYSLISITAAQIITHSNILCYKWWLHETEHVRSNYLRCHMTMMTSFIPLVGKDLFHFKQKVLLCKNKSNTSCFYCSQAFTLVVANSHQARHWGNPLFQTWNIQKFIFSSMYWIACLFHSDFSVVHLLPIS